MSTQARQWRIFYVYTLWSVLAMIIAIPALTLMVIGAPAAEELRDHPVGALLLLIQTVLVAESARAALAHWAAAPIREERGRWDLPHAGVLSSGAARLILAAVPTPLIGLLALLGEGSRLLLVLSAVVLAVGVLLRYPWPWSAGVAAAGMLLIPAGLVPGIALPLITVTFAAVLTVRLSIWLGAVVRELDIAREAQGQLAVAEERLRFARDLHDVTGRDLSVIAVKAELRGTASLLRSAHVDVTIEGSADAIPPQHREAAAWVLRESGTNILRHADPTAVQIALTAQGITMTNDGVPGGPDGSDGAGAIGEAGGIAGSDAHECAAVREGAGLTGMRERLGPRAHLETIRAADRFTLAVRFDPAGGPA